MQRCRWASWGTLFASLVGKPILSRPRAPRLKTVMHVDTELVQAIPDNVAGMIGILHRHDLYSYSRFPGS